jgi:two-component system, NtrC family, sensor kinase
MTNNDSSERVLVVAPIAGDGPAVASLLNEHGFAAELCQSLTEVCAHVAGGAGALLLAEEALELAHTPELFDQLKAQPPWSELPVIILTQGGESRLARLLDLASDAAGAITVLERPIATGTLLRSIEVALRSRRRQYQVKQRQQQLAERARLLDLSSDAILVRDWDGGILYWNHGAEKIYGWKREEAMGKNIHALLHTRFPKSLQELSAELSQTGEWTGELEHITRDGRQITVLCRKVLDRDAQGNIVAVLETNTDITERKQVEAMLREQQESLRRIEKIAAAGQLAAALAHEINNPLASVTNVLYLLETNRELTQEAKRLVTTGASELDRVGRIVRQSLSYYRAGTVPGNLDLSAIAEESLQVFGDKFRRAGIEVTKRLTPNAQIMGFADEVRQVIDNLLLNAVEAFRGGGRLAVSVRLSRNWRDGKQGVRLTIGDTGSGIAKENLSHIFEPFFTTKSEKGTGLGLWVVLGIVTKHEGRIRIRSAAGTTNSGTVVSILWPSKGRALRALTIRSQSVA